MNEDLFGPLEELTNGESSQVSKKPFLNPRLVSNLRYYGAVLPSIALPFTFGVSDGVNHSVVSDDLRYASYVGGVFLHNYKHEPGAQSDVATDMTLGLVLTVGSYFAGRMIGAIAERFS